MPQTSGLKTTLITGASSGIGLELARICAAHGHDLVLVARSHERLHAVAGDLADAYNVKTTTVELDLASARAVDTLVKKLAKHDIDIVMNNAGFGGVEAMAEADIARDRDMIQVNSVVPTELMAALLPAMVKRGRGRILNVASMAALAPGPGMAVYHATKSYVLSLSQAVNQELVGTGVSVTALCPGPTKTSWADHAGLKSARFNASAMSAREVAQAGYDGMIGGKPVVYVGTKNKLAAIGLRFVPTSQILKRINWRKSQS